MRLLTTRSELGLGPRLPLPADIEHQMKLWRQELIPMPQSYIDWHRQRADEALQALVTLCPNLRVVDRQMRDEGWADGMRELHAIVETPTGRVVKLVYHDGNQAFMVQLNGGGCGALRDTDLA